MMKLKQQVNSLPRYPALAPRHLCWLLICCCLGLISCTEKPRRPTGATNKQHSTVADRKQLLHTLFTALSSWDLTLNDQEQKKFVLDRANNWMQSATDTGLVAEFEKQNVWSAEPLLQQLPKEYQPQAGWYNIDKLSFFPEDIDALRELNTLQQIVRQVEQRHATTIKASPLRPELALANQLLDWTVKNVRLETPSWDATANSWQVPSYSVEALQTPFLALYRGAATVASRSWVFAELLRQANLNPVLLAVVDDGPEQRVRYALVAVLLPRASDSQQSDLYLFDAQLGLPLNNVEDQPLTLAELAKQPELLRRWDVADLKYPLANDDVAKLQALLIAAPSNLSKRMRVLQYEAPEKQLALGTKAIPTLTKQAEQCRAAGCERITLWQHPWLVMSKRTNPDPKQIQAFQRQLLPFQLQLPIPVDRDARSNRKEKSSDNELVENAELSTLFEVDPDTGEVRMKELTEKKIPTLLEVNKPAEINPQTGEILRLTDDITIISTKTLEFMKAAEKQGMSGAKQADATTKEFARALRNGRLNYLQGNWYRSAATSASNNDPTNVSLLSEQRGAMDWFQLCQQDEQNLARLFRSFISVAQWKKLEDLLGAAQVKTTQLRQLRELLITASLFPADIDLLIRGLTAPGRDAAMTREFIDKLLSLKNPKQTLELFYNLYVPTKLLEASELERRALPYFGGLYYSKSDYPLPTRSSLWRIVHQVERQAQFWQAKTLLEEASFDNAELTLSRLSDLELPEWQPSLNLARARLYSDWASKIASADPTRAKTLRKQAIELFQADQTPEQHGSRLRAKQLATLVEEQ